MSPTMAFVNLQHDVKLKLLLIGDCFVGKTCIMRKYCTGSYVSTEVKTIGIDILIKTEVVDSTRIQLQIWDTAGQERFRTIASSHFRGAHGILLVYDITDLRSFQSVRSWVTEVRQHADTGVCMMLVGNKSDMTDEREVPSAEGAALAGWLNIPFLEISAKTGCVRDAFFILAREAKNQMQAAQRGFSMEVHGTDWSPPIVLTTESTASSLPTCGCY